MACHRTFCPWVQDSNDSNRYVCLDCGKERQIDRNPPWFLIIIVAIFVALLLDRASYDSAPAIDTPNQSSYEQNAEMRSSE